MVGGSIYDTVASRVDIASYMGPHLHFMSTCSMFLDCKTVKCLSFKCRYDAREAQKPGMSFEFSFPRRNDRA